MTEQALNQLTRRVMLDAARLEYGGLPEEPHPFSPAFERKMKKLLRRGRHPVWYKTLHAAACLLLALLLSGCAVLAVSPEAREVFAGWVREVYENAFVYRFYGEEQGDRELLQETETFYRPSWVPEGYRIIHATEGDGVTFFVYRDDSGAQISFACIESGGAVQVTGDNGAVYQKVRVNGRSADLYMDRDPEEANVLVWTDASGESIFSITGVLSGEELVKIAESLEAVPRDVVYRPGRVPEGYFQVSAEDLDGCSVLTYRNKEAECLTVSFGYADLSEEESAEASSVFVGENPADVYLDRADGGVRHLTWVDGDSGISFRVSGPLEGRELIRIGESLEAFPEPPPEDRKLTWVPAGYREIDRVRLTGQDHVSYQNDRGDRISFGYHPGIESSGLYVIPSGEEGLTPQTVLVNGKEADFYPDEGAASGLVWMEDGLLFSLLGYCSAQELVAMAESQEVILPDRRPSWVPEDYVLYERSFLHSKESATTIYENPKGEFLIFRCQPNENDRPFHLFPNEGSVEKQASVNGHPADLYSNPEPGRISELCWSDEEAFYYLSGDLSDEEILKMAGSVQKLPPIPVTHIPTWLPLGYRNTSTSGGLWSREAEYENEAGEQLQFRFARRGQEEEPMEECLTEIREAVAGLEGQETTVDGCPGRLYLGGGVNHLLWGAEGGEEVYWLSGPLDEEALLEIARGVHGEAE
nr:DUF4367 domain-containing protein [uncultured Oscillibacter sp.]